MVIIVLLIALLCALAWHALLERYWLASVGSTLTSIFLVWVIASHHLGYFDKEFVENIVIIGGLAFLVSLVVGFGIRQLKSKSAKEP